MRTAYALILLVAVGGAARASNPTSIYVYPSKLEFSPDEQNATKVVIHGAFFFNTGNGTYGAPKCGYMYFSCQPGQEAMCRMQWQEIKAAIGGPSCEGFGDWNMVWKTWRQGSALVGGTPDAPRPEDVAKLRPESV